VSHVVRSLQIERVRQCHHVSRVGIHVVPRRTLCRAAVATPVMCDNAVALREEVQHLVVPVVGTQGPSMMEHNRLGIAGTPIFVEDVSAIFRGHGTHCRCSCMFRRPLTCYTVSGRASQSQKTKRDAVRTLTAPVSTRRLEVTASALLSQSSREL